MTESEALKLALEALENNKQKHHYCEDTWYSCPKHEDGCANEAEGDECNCGTDEINAQFDKAITAIKEALAQPEQELLAWKNAALRVGEDLSSVGPNGYYNMTAQQWLDWAMAQQPRGNNSLAQPEQEPVAHTLNCVCGAVWDIKADGSEEMVHTPDTTPPQRTWFGLTPDDFRQLEKETTVNGYNGDYCPTWDLIEAVEEKLKEKNT